MKSSSSNRTSPLHSNPPKSSYYKANAATTPPTTPTTAAPFLTAPPVAAAADAVLDADPDAAEPDALAEPLAPRGLPIVVVAPPATAVAVCETVNLVRRVELAPVAEAAAPALILSAPAVTVMVMVPTSSACRADVEAGRTEVACAETQLETSASLE